MDTIKIGDKLFKYSLKRKSVRSLKVKLKSQNSFEITCPLLTPNFVISRFLVQNSKWIIKNSQKIQKIPPITSLRHISILGEEYQFVITKASKESLIINQKEHKIYLYTKIITQSHTKTLFEKEFKKVSLSLIKHHLKQLKTQYGFTFNRVSVKNQRSRFASCSSQGNLNFNWQIIFFPVDKFVHLLLHELTHLEIKNHSKNFYAKLAEYDPNYQANNRWLSTHGRKQYLIKP